MYVQELLALQHEWKYMCYDSKLIPIASHKSDKKLMNFTILSHCSTYLWERAALIHWGRMTQICVNMLGLAPSRCLVSVEPLSDRILLIENLRTNFIEHLSEIHIFSYKKMYSKMSSAKWRQCCFGQNGVLYISSLGGSVTTAHLTLRGRLTHVCCQLGPH